MTTGDHSRPSPKFLEPTVLQISALPEGESRFMLGASEWNLPPATRCACTYIKCLLLRLMQLI